MTQELRWSDPELELKLIALNISADRVAGIMQHRPRTTQVYMWVPIPAGFPRPLDPDESVLGKAVECVATITP